MHIEFHRLPKETVRRLAEGIEFLVRKANSLKTHDYKKHEIDRNFDDDSNTTIQYSTNTAKKESITSIINRRT